MQQVQKAGLLSATYAASTGFFTPAATPTDFCGLVNTAAAGNAQVLKLVRCTIEATQTTAGINAFYLILRSTANTGGTPTNLDIVPFDQSNTAGTAGWAVKYAANPSPLGTAIGTGSTGIMAIRNISTPAPASVVTGAEAVLYDDKYEGQPVVLRAGGQGIYVNFNTAAVPAGLSLNVNFWFTRQ